MTLPQILIWSGTALAVLGLIGLAYCIIRVLSIRREADAEAATIKMRKMVVVNMTSVGIASIGLMTVVVGIIL